jgi:hypothetical protein
VIQVVRVLGIVLVVCLGLKLLAAMVTPLLPVAGVLFALSLVWLWVGRGRHRL